MAKYVAYVGTYTHEKSEGIYVYDVDPDTGVLKQRSVAKISNPSNLVVAHNKKFLYSITDEGIAAYKILKDGDLEKINQEWIGGMRGCHVTCDSQDRYCFVAGYHDGRVSMMHINEDGSIGAIADGIFHQGVGKSVAEKKLEPHVTCVELTPDERFLCAVDNGLHQIKLYAIDYERGKIKLADIIRCEIDSAPRRMRFSADGKFAYVMTEGTNEIYVYSYKDTGKVPEFELIQEITLLTGLKEEIASGTNIKFSKDGDYLFASVDGLNAVTMYKVDKKSGKLSYFAHTYISGDYPKSFAILPGTKYFVSLNHDTNEIRSFIIDHKEGHCLMVNPPISIVKPNCIAIHNIEG